ncbi:hypothetical protein FNP_1097 [Fusobacterium polymorphum ATCC 10953]|uniref:Uncharacterized protein n=1 Tax=Fusobacterium polymorphum ATCC 10953 TaxID=393480 RepID=A5TVF9_FUSNP|nr:hypothetical protein FNP_1097 [Fusobacterium polymorphum ATCC 10953]
MKVIKYYDSELFGIHNYIGIIIAFSYGIVLLPFLFVLN